MAAVNIDQNNFNEMVLNSDRKVLLDFWAPWCGPCRMVVPIVEEIAEEREDVLVGKINVDENPEPARQFGVMTIPTLVVMENGRELQRSSGARPKAAILNMLHGWSKRSSTIRWAMPGYYSLWQSFTKVISWVVSARSIISFVIIPMMWIWWRVASCG